MYLLQSFPHLFVKIGILVIQSLVLSVLADVFFVFQVSLPTFIKNFERILEFLVKIKIFIS